MKTLSTQRFDFLFMLALVVMAVPFGSQVVAQTESAAKPMEKANEKASADEAKTNWGQWRGPNRDGIVKDAKSVSYTHLTLPTIYSV